jgi:hypothetical protein
MHIHCKCGQQITKTSLFLTKKWKKRSRNNWEVTPGSFLKSNLRWTSNWIRKTFEINRTDVVADIVSTFEEGMGCCDISIGVECPKCKSEIGLATYDCYHSYHSVGLFRNAVTVNHNRV